MAKVAYDRVLKICLIGDVGVGKSSLIHRLFDPSPGALPSSKSTVTIDFKVKDYQVNNQVARVTVWDTAGQERYNAIASSNYRDADAIIVVYSVTDRESFTRIQMWVNKVGQFCQPYCQLVLVANKSDCKHLRKVSVQEGVALAKSLRAMYSETSSKTGHNVQLAFFKVVATLVRLDLGRKNVSSIQKVNLRSDQEADDFVNKCC